MTLRKFHEEITHLLTNYPELANVPIIYSRDDEGNGYQKVHESPTPARAENLDEWELEVEGYLEDMGGDISRELINCVIIN